MVVLFPCDSSKMCEKVEIIFCSLYILRLVYSLGTQRHSSSFQGQNVAIKKLDSNRIMLSRDLLLEFKKVPSPRWSDCAKVKATQMTREFHEEHSHSSAFANMQQTIELLWLLFHLLCCLQIESVHCVVAAERHSSRPLDKIYRSLCGGTELLFGYRILPEGVSTGHSGGRRYHPRLGLSLFTSPWHGQGN